MSSFEDRINNEINKEIAGPIYKNETKIFSQIAYAIKEKGVKQHKEIRLGDVSYDDPNFINTICCGVARIQRSMDEIRYYMHSGEVGFVVLAEVNQNDVKFPIYGTEVSADSTGRKMLKEEGTLPLTDVKDTVRETIENNIRKHPILGKYADIILGDFDEILSLDSERKIIPISKEARMMAAQKVEIDSLKKENIQQKSVIEHLMERIKGIPFFGKRILASLSQMLPEEKEDATREENLTVSKPTDRDKLIQSLNIDVPGISGIQDDKDKKEQQPIKTDSEIVD